MTTETNTDSSLFFVETLDDTFVRVKVPTILRQTPLIGDAKQAEAVLVMECSTPAAGIRQRAVKDVKKACAAIVFGDTATFNRTVVTCRCKQVRQLF